MTLQKYMMMMKTMVLLSKDSDAIHEIGETMIFFSLAREKRGN